MAKVQYYGIKFPFQNNNENNFFVDLNKNDIEKTRSELLHLIFTPKGQRLRDPEFGTDLIRFIYEPNDSESWSAIESEIKEAVSFYLPYVNLDSISVAQSESDVFAVYVKLIFSIIDGNTKKTDSVVVSI